MNSRKKASPSPKDRSGLKYVLQAIPKKARAMIIRLKLTSKGNLMMLCSCSFIIQISRLFEALLPDDKPKHPSVFFLLPESGVENLYIL